MARKTSKAKAPAMFYVTTTELESGGMATGASTLRDLNDYYSTIDDGDQIAVYELVGVKTARAAEIILED